MNISPIFPYHSMIIPYINQNLPQMLSPEIIEVIIKLSQEENIKILYNSIGANASVNHLHMHIIFLS